MASNGSSGSRNLISAILPVAAVITCAAAAVVAFWPAMGNDFVYDDWPIIVNNPTVTEPGPWYRFWQQKYWPKTGPVDVLYRPLTMATFRLNALLTGGVPDASTFRLVNIAMHALASIGVLFLTWRVLATEAEPQKNELRPRFTLRNGDAARFYSRFPLPFFVPLAAGWATAMLFAVHPIHTEAVVTGYGRSELMAGMFGVWLLFRHARPPDPDRRRPLRFHTVSAMLFLAAVMSKEHALFLWPAIMLIDLWHYRRLQSRPPIREWLNRHSGIAHAGFALAAGTFFLLRYSVYNWRFTLPVDKVDPLASPVTHAGLIEHLLLPFKLLALIGELLIWPPSLSPTWSIPALSLPTHLEPSVIVGMLLFGAMVALTVLLWRRRSPFGAWVGGTIVILLVPTHALPVAHFLFAERWLYLPTIFFAVSLAAVVRWFDRAALPAVGVVILALLPSTWQYASKFSDNITMHSETVLRQPYNYHANRTLAATLWHAGHPAEAVQVAQQAVERFGPTAELYDILILSYLDSGDARGALETIQAYRAEADALEQAKLDKLDAKARALLEDSENNVSGRPTTLPLESKSQMPDGEVERYSSRPPPNGVKTREDRRPENRLELK